MLRSSMIAGLVVSMTMVLGACESSVDTSAMPTTAPAAPAMGVLNDTCPVMGGPVNPDASTVSYGGYEIGFCCNGCVGGWNDMSDADKNAFLAKFMK